MNMLYETMRSGVATVIVVPASALESMNLGAIGGISALSQSANQRPADTGAGTADSPLAGSPGPPGPLGPLV
jgi:hypothetical protein